MAGLEQQIYSRRGFLNRCLLAGALITESAMNLPTANAQTGQPVSIPTYEPPIQEVPGQIRGRVTADEVERRLIQGEILPVDLDMLSTELVHTLNVEENIIEAGGAIGTALGFVLSKRFYRNIASRRDFLAGAGIAGATLVGRGLGLEIGRSTAVKWRFAHMKSFIADQLSR